MVYLLLLLLIPQPLAALDLRTLIAQGDEAFDHRAEGRQGLRPDPKPISHAIEAFQQALQQDPGNVEARWRLLRATVFKGHYATPETSDKKKVFEEGKTVVAEGLRLLDQQIKTETGKDTSTLSAEDRAALLKKVPGSGEFYYYAGSIWAEWSQAYGIMRAVREGSAAKIRDFATVCSLIDDHVRYGGGYRTLGRLHHKCPKVPFMTGWISHGKALEYLEKAYRVDPKRKFNRFYYAEALYDIDPSRRAEAIAMVKQLIADAPDADLLVEDLNLQKEAKADLKAWNVK